MLGPTQQIKEHGVFLYLYFYGRSISTGLLAYSIPYFYASYHGPCIIHECIQNMSKRRLRRSSGYSRFATTIMSIVKSTETVVKSWTLLQYENRTRVLYELLTDFSVNPKTSTEPLFTSHTTTETPSTSNTPTETDISPNRPRTPSPPIPNSVTHLIPPPTSAVGRTTDF